MANNSRVIITVPAPLDRKRKAWRKHLTAIDPTQSTGYAFVGDWLKAGERAELPAGSFILGYDTAGSQKNWYPVIRLWAVTPDGLILHDSYEGTVQEVSWALAVRDRFAAILAEHPPAPDPLLATIPTDALIAELTRRGYPIPMKGE